MDQQQRPANVSLAIQLAFPSRTYESIKGLRKGSRYQAMLEACRGTNGGGQASSPASGPGGPGLDGGHGDGGNDQGTDVPMDRETVLGELTEACRRDAALICLKPEELEEAIGVVALGNADPVALNRLQVLIDAEYSQWVSTLETPKHKTSPQDSASAQTTQTQGRRVRRACGGGVTKGDTPKPLSKRVLRRRLYGIVQKLYRKNRSECAKRVLSGDWAKEPKDTPLAEQDSFWRPLFEGESKPDSREPTPVCRTLHEMVRPVTRGV